MGLKLGGLISGSSQYKTAWFPHSTGVNHQRKKTARFVAEMGWIPLQFLIKTQTALYFSTIVNVLRQNVHWAGCKSVHVIQHSHYSLKRSCEESCNSFKSVFLVLNTQTTVRNHEHWIYFWNVHRDSTNHVQDPETTDNQWVCQSENRFRSQLVL